MHWSLEVPPEEGGPSRTPPADINQLLASSLQVYMWGKRNTRINIQGIGVSVIDRMKGGGEQPCRP